MPSCSTGAGGNFCSGGDVHEIIGPLIKLKAPELLMFTRMTGDLVKAMRHCPQPIVAAIDGVCAGAGAIIAMASDLRFGTARTRPRSCSTASAWPAATWARARCCRASSARAARRAAVHRPCAGRRGGAAWGFFNRLCAPEDGAGRGAWRWPGNSPPGPTFANGITKTMLHQEWAMGIDQAIEAEAQAQAICMLTEDFGRAYEAFAAKQKPVFEGN